MSYNEQPIRVLHLVNVETANYYINNLFDYSDPREVRISAVTLAPRRGFVEELERRGATVYALDRNSRSRYAGAATELMKILNSERVDVVHTHLYDPTLLGLFIGKVRRRKVVVTRHH